MRRTGWLGPRLRIKRSFVRFRKDKDGATAVEFAMVAVPFLGLLFAIFETAFVFFVTEALESAAADASRTIMTGQAHAGAYSNGAAFRTAVICPKLPSFITCSNVILDVRTAGNSGATAFSTADVSKSFYTTPSAAKYCIGSQGDVVIMRAVYPMPVYLSLLTATNVGNVSKSTAGQTNYTSADGTAGMKRILMATAAFRNEPFGAQALASGCT